MPESLGRLRRIRRIGAGGFATVWLYRDDDLDSLVAVKALADNWAQQLDVRERFLEEARVLRRADADHVVRVYDLGETDDETPYFVMTYADQGTVADVLAEGPVPAKTAVDLVEQAASGLAALHASGVVHRDVKPANLLLCSDSRRGRRLLVADLGLAKALLHASGLTQIVGTPAYMAPEQADVGVGIDERADVHALGAVAYHMMVGHPIRRVTMSSVTEAALPVPLSQLADVSPGVDEVVLRALAPDREDRWPNPTEFAAALSAATADHLADVSTFPTRSAATDVPNHPTLTATRVESAPPVGDKPQVRRWRRWALLGTVLVLLGGVGLAGAIWMAGGDNEDGAQSAYCRALENRGSDLARLGKTGDPTTLEAMTRAVHAIRDAAPDPVAAEWSKLDDPLQEFQSKLDSKGLTWSDVGTPAIRNDARELIASLDDATNDIDDELIRNHAQDECGIDLSELGVDGNEGPLA